MINRIDNLQPLIQSDYQKLVDKESKNIIEVDFKDKVNINSINIPLIGLSKTDVNIDNLPDFSKTPLGIGIAVKTTNSSFSVKKGSLYLNNTNQKITEIDGNNFKVSLKNDSFELFKDGNFIGKFKGKLLIKPDTNITDNFVKINNRAYRGEIEIIISPTTPSTFNVINLVTMEDYLKGVVPAESSASWDIEALKAQAIAARTYAVSNWRKQYSEGFDLTATVSDQVYKGVEVEDERTNLAVKETAGKVITYNDKPINALFFACSGGKTDSALEVWGIDLPYIKPVQDFDYNAPKYRWTQKLSSESIRKNLEKLNINVGQIKEIIPQTFTSVGRIKTIKIVGTNGEAILNGNQFRLSNGLNSTFFTVESSVSLSRFIMNKILNKTDDLPTHFIFKGRGWGHGLGMSQWGAKEMAHQGYDHEKILKHYYTGVDLTVLY